MAKNTSKVKKVAVLTSGGDASGMNACVRACVRYALDQGYEVYGVKHGYKGMVNDEIFKMEYSSVSNCVHAGGTILRSSRCPEFKEAEVMNAAVENLLKRGIENLIVIGGDGSFRGVEAMHEGTKLNVIGIPGTIDNDMGYTDSTIGFDTACNTVVDAILKLRDTITSHDRIMILEVMGRECGNIALNSAVAGGAEYVIVPEVDTDVDEVAASIKRGFDKGKSSSIIVLAEGKTELTDELTQKISDATGRRVNHMALKWMQRGGIPTVEDRVLAAKMACRAVELVECGQSGRVIGIKGGEIFDTTVLEALACKKGFDQKLYELAQIISK